MQNEQRKNENPQNKGRVMHTSKNPKLSLSLACSGGPERTLNCKPYSQSVGFLQSYTRLIGPYDFRTGLVS